MDRNLLFRYGLIVITVIILYFSYLITKPYLVTICMAFILTFILHPVYKWLKKYVKFDWLASAILIFLVLLVLIIPSAVLVTKLVNEAASAYLTVLQNDVVLENLPILQYLPENFLESGQEFIDQIARGGSKYVAETAPDVLGSVAGGLLNLFVFFFVMFFANISGVGWYRTFKRVIPLRPEVKKHLFSDLEQVVYGITYGQLLTAIIQGSLGGIMFFVFGIPNPIFWGFIMIIFSFIPFLGTPIIFVPAAIIELVQGDYIAGIGVLVIGFVVVSNVDNFVRPYLVSKFAPIHPIIVIIGVLGGLQAFGFAGMILGPLLLALLFTLIKDFSAHKNLLKT